MSTSNLKVLTPFFAEKALKELGEDPATRMTKIQELREAYISAHGEELPLERTDDNFLIRFLRARKYDHKRSLELLYNYHKFAQEHPDYFEAGTKEEAEDLLSKQVLGVLPVRAKDGSSVIYIEAGNLDPDKISPQGLRRASNYFMEKLMDDEGTQIAGVSMVEDLKGLSLSKAMKIETKEEQKAKFYFLQYCLPMRLKGIHMCNEGLLVDIFMFIIRPFLSKKLANRFFAHGTNYEKLSKAFDMDGIPKKLGGNLDYDFKTTLDNIDRLTRD